MASLVYVRLNDARLLPFASAFSITKGQNVVVDIDGIAEFGTVEFEKIGDAEIVGNVVRIATENDIAQNKRMLDFQADDKAKVREHLDKLGIEM